MAVQEQAGDRARAGTWTLIAAALAQLEVETGTAIAASVDPATLDRWRASVSELRPDGQTQQSWLWAAPAKHSTRQISEVLERIDLLYTLDVHKHLADIPDLILRRYARRLVSGRPQPEPRSKSQRAPWRSHAFFGIACSPPQTS